MEKEKTKISVQSPRKILSILCIICFVGLMIAGFIFVGKPILQFAAQPERFRAWVQGHGVLGKLAFVGMMAAQVVIAIIPGEPLEIGAGYAFGALEGTVLCLAGAMLGSAIVFLFVRKFGVLIVELFFSKEKIHSLRFLRSTKRLNMLLFLVFFIPGTPKDLLAYMVGLTPVKFGAWMLITGFARIPSVISSTIGGDALNLQNYQFAILVFAITVAISVVGIILYRNVCKQENARELAEEKNELKIE